MKNPRETERYSSTLRAVVRKKSNGAPPSPTSQLSKSIHTKSTLNTHTHIQNFKTNTGIARSVVRRTSPSVSVANFSRRPPRTSRSRSSSHGDDIGMGTSLSSSSIASMSLLFTYFALTLECMITWCCHEALS